MNRRELRAIEERIADMRRQRDAFRAGMEFADDGDLPTDSTRKRTMAIAHPDLVLGGTSTASEELFLECLAIARRVADESPPRPANVLAEELGVGRPKAQDWLRLVRYLAVTGEIP
jgi:hypothetical protein